ncbi:hypothetical protein [Psychroserpens sp. S379A]
MKQKEQDYNGFWKHLGCFLFVLVGLVFLGVFLVILNMMFFKIDF